jgi:excisionase family DNA binding protein
MSKKTSKKPGELLSAKQAAERLNLTEQQTRALIRDGKLPATRIGRAWIIDAGDLPLAEKRPRPGRPRKKRKDDDDDE